MLDCITDNGQVLMTCPFNPRAMNHENSKEVSKCQEAMVKVHYREAVPVKVEVEWEVLKLAPAENVYVRNAVIKNLMREVSRAIRQNALNAEQS